LENFIDSANDLLPALIDHTDNATPITTTHVLLICYVALQMLELPKALQYINQWKALFRTLTNLGNHSLGIAPCTEPASYLADDVNAQPESSPQPSPAPFTIQPAQLTGIEFEQVQELVERCLQEVQRHDTHVLDSRPGGYLSHSYFYPSRPNDYFAQPMTLLELNEAYEKWLPLFTFEHSVIEDEFVAMLGRIFKLAMLDIPGDEDKLQYFRLRKLGILESNQAGSAQAVDRDTAATNDVQNDGVQNDDNKDVGEATDDADGDQSLPVE
jgi:hypothetical protein